MAGNTHTTQTAVTPWATTDFATRSTQVAAAAWSGTSFKVRVTELAATPWTWTAFKVRTTQAAAVAWVVTCSSSSYTPPAGEGVIGLSAANAGADIALTWTTTDTELSYSVYRGTSSGGEGGTPIASGIWGLSWTDTTVLPGTRYWYIVKGSDACGNSTASGEVSAATAPAGLAAVGECEETIALTWTASAGATGYKVLRSTDGVTFTQYATVTLPAYADTGASPTGTTYYYEVEATYSGGLTSAATASVSAASVYPPAQVMGLTAVAGPGAHQATLRWTADEGDVTYDIYRATAPGAEGDKPYATGIVDTVWVDVYGVESGWAYYTVLAVLPGGCQGEPSAEASVLMHCCTPWQRDAVTCGQWSVNSVPTDETWQRNSAPAGTWERN